MARVYRADDWDSYKMVYREPHRAVEPPEREMAVVDAALAALVEAGALPHGDYDRERFLAHRAAVAEQFEIPWTAITPRMQRLLYAISAIAQPQHMVAAGVFCGNTFISNAGAAVGPGACYAAQACIGVEIKPEEAERAERNVRRIDPTAVARVVAADAIDVCRDYPPTAGRRSARASTSPSSRQRSTSSTPAASSSHTTASTARSGSPTTSPSSATRSTSPTA